MIPLLSKINCIADLFYMITHWYITMAFRNRWIYTYVFIPAFNLEKIRSYWVFFSLKLEFHIHLNIISTFKYTRQKTAYWLKIQQRG